MADSVVTIGADLSALRRDLAKMPNMSADAAQKTLIKLERTVKRAEAASKRAIKNTKRARVQASKEAEKAAKDAREGFKGVIELAGVSGDKIDKLGAVFGALSSPVGLATVALTAAAAAAVAGAAAVVGMGVASVKLVRASRELADELYAYREIEAFQGMQPEALARIDRANASLDAVGVIAKQLVIGLGAELSPAVERAARFLGGMGLAAIDAFNAFADGGNLVLRVAQLVGQGMIKAFSGPIDEIMRLLTIMQFVADKLGVDGVAGQLREVTEAWDDFTMGLSTDLVDALGDGFERLEFSVSGYGEELDQIIDKAGQLASAAARGGQAQQAAAAAQQSYGEGSINIYDRMIGAMDEVMDQTQAMHDQAEQLADKEKKAAQMRAQIIGAAYLDVVGSFADGAKLIAKQLAAENEEAALAAFRVYQAAAISQALIAGAVSVSTIWRDWAGYPPVAAALTAATMANTTLQVATIASEQPTFHRGGMVRASGPSHAPDEVSAVLRDREAVLNSTAAARMGRSNIASLNAGGVMHGGGGVAAVEFRNKTSAAMLSDQQRRQGTPIKQHRRRGRGYGY